LLPLLKSMHERAGDDDARVGPVLSRVRDKHRGMLLRDHLHAADVTRPRLSTSTATLRPVDFRSMRDSGITWLALAGVSLQAIKRRAGHEDIHTTDGYAKAAEDLAGKVGAPFAPLPEGLGQSLDQGPQKPRRKGSGTRVSNTTGEDAPDPEKTAGSSSGVGDIPSGPAPVQAAQSEAEQLEPSAQPKDERGDALEAALADAITKATGAGEWAIVAQLARELEARRTARAGAKVVPFPRRRGERS
jgi:hypothetical protein